MGNAVQALDVILEYIENNRNGHTKNFCLDFKSFHGPTPLWYICRWGQWGNDDVVGNSVKKLCDAGARLLCKQPEQFRLPLIEALMGPDALTFAKTWLGKWEVGVIKEGDVKETALEYLVRSRFNKDMEEGEETFAVLLIELRVADEVVEVFAPPDTAGPIHVVDAELEEGLRAAKPKHKCSVVGCADQEDVTLCQTCGQWFCRDHFDAHE
jgi:hypothetical protein